MIRTGTEDSWPAAAVPPTMKRFSARDRHAGTRLGNALIAVTAIEYKLSLFTRNVVDFQNIRGLRLREIG